MSGALRKRAARWQHLVAALDPTVKGMLWAILAGLLFCQLNVLMRLMATALNPFETQFLRYFFGVVVLLPLLLRGGLAAYRPQRIGGQFARGAVHTLGLLLWFAALPNTPLADLTALGFTTPIFILIGSRLMFGEPMRWDRWLAVMIGFAGVLVVVAPALSGSGGIYHLMMLASAPVFAVSMLLSKSLTRHERIEVIVVWQSITVTIFSLPLALLHWQTPTPGQWLVFLLCGLIGSAGHYCLTRSFVAIELSATQSVRFLDLVWAALMGWLVFADVPTQSTLIGGLVIAASTIWITRREARGRARR